MRRRNLVIAAGVVAALVAWIAWKVVGGRAPAGDGGESSTSGGATAGAGAHRMRAGAGGAIGRVQGTVLDLADRKPVAGVDVTFGNALGESTATSDPGGHYSLQLAPGSYRVVAIGEGMLGAAGTRFELRAGQSVEGYDVWVARLAKLHGRVVDKAGNPVGGARVAFKAVMGGKPISSEQTAPIGEATADDAGRFEIEVPAGDVKLIAEVGDVRGQAVLTGVVPGHEPPEVTIVLGAGAGIEGVVVDSRHAPAPAAEVHVTVTTGDGPTRERIATTDDGGRFAFDHLASGNAMLEARGETGVSPPYLAKLRDGHTKRGVELVLADAASIAGRVVDGKGAPVAGASVRATPAKSTIPARPVTSGADGTFLLDALAAGTRHVVQARHEGYAAAFARNVVPPAEGIELVMQSAGGIRGVVKGAGGARVASFQVQVERFVASDGAVRPGKVASRFSSDDGRFELDLVDPGRYDLVVTADGFAPTRPPRVAVPPEGWAEIQVELAGGGRVTGRVTSGGQPVAAARVAISAGYEGPPVFSDADGHFTLVDVAPGRRSVSASKAGMASAHRDDVEVRAGQTVDVELALSGGGAAGAQVGIGVVLVRSSQARPLVWRLRPRGPAARAGIQKRDLVMAIDGISTLDMPADEARAHLLGPPGSTVRVEVERAGRPLRFDIARQAGAGGEEP